MDLARRMVRVEAELSKNHLSREIELTDDLCAGLTDLRSQAALQRGSLPDGDEYVFSYKKRPWSTDRLYGAFRATVAGCAAAIPDAKRRQLRLHDIRHSVGSVLATGGLSLEIIAKVLGHKSLETTRRYAHLMPSVVSQAARVIQASIPRPDADRVSEARAG